MAHGAVEWYTRSAWDARTAWIDLQERTGTHIWEPIGVAWFARSEDGFEARSRELLGDLGIPVEWLSPDEARSLYPTLHTDDLAGVLYEPAAGVLHARRATQLLVAEALAAGARLEGARVVPDNAPQGDAVVWACGAWLPKLFPQQVDIRISRRDVFFFGADAAWRGPPGFCDYDAGFYGHGDLANPSAPVVKLGRVSMRAKPWEVPDGLWERIEPLLPARSGVSVIRVVSRSMTGRCCRGSCLSCTRGSAGSICRRSSASAVG